MIINYVLLILGTLSVFLSMKSFLEKRSYSRLFFYLMGLGVCTLLWCYGYAFMGLTNRLSIAYRYRQLALLGVGGFMSLEVLLFSYISGISSKIRKIEALLLIPYILGDVLIWGAKDVRRYTRVGDRTFYVNGSSNGFYYQPITMVIISIILFVIYFRWKKRMKYSRDIRLRKYVLISNIFIFLGTIPDTILPILGLDSYPTSPLGAVATMLAMQYVLTQYTRYNMSREHICNHVYRYEKAGYMAFNLQGRLEIANPYAMKELGIVTIENQRLSDLFVMHDLYDVDVIKRILTEGEGDYFFEGKYTNKSFSLNLSLIKDMNSDPYCILGALYDRSREKELIEEIRESGEAKSSFLANMSHEIRTPINAILGMSEMILRESADVKILDYANNMSSAGEHLLTIVNDILDYSKIQSDMMDIIPVDYDLSIIMHTNVLQYRQKAKDKGIEFIVEAEPSIPIYLNGDEVRINQILKNIFDNAVKYTDEGSIVFKVDKEDISEDEIRLIFKVKDSGKGIKEEELKKLFDAFERADHNANQTIAGSGLGLAIVGRLVKMMGGEILVESDFGKGSEFTIKLPQRIVSYQLMGDYEKALEDYYLVNEKGWKGEYTAPAARILVVDDNNVNLNVAKYLLNRTRAMVDTATSGEKALELIRKNAYQLVFLDHIMPGMDGVETLNEIRREHLLLDVPVICLSANDIAGAREMYTDYGFTDFLPKPISGGSLEKKVYDYLPKSFIHEEKNVEAAGEAEEKNYLSLSSNREEDELLQMSLKQGKNIKNEDMTHIFVINPQVIDTSKMEAIREYLASEKELRYFVFTVNQEGGETLLVKKVQDYFPSQKLRIYSIGGSGTLRNILNGIEDFERVELACCPMGLTNDFMKTFETDSRLFTDIRNLVRGEAVKIDYIETSGGRALNTFSIGLDSNLVQMLDSSRLFKVFGQSIPYVIAFVYSMFISAPDEYEVCIDDEKVEGTFAQIIFANGNTLGGTFGFSEKCIVNDGKAEVLIGGKYQGLGLLPTVMAMIKKDMNTLNKLAILRQASDFSIRRRDGGQLAMNFDGEMEYGIEKWEAHIVKEGLSFVLPKGVTLHEQ